MYGQKPVIHGGIPVNDNMKQSRWTAKLKLFVVMIIVMITAVLAGCGFSLSSESEKPVNILVLGVDLREGDIGRSDTIFVMSFNKETNKATMLSIPRDSRVQIPGRGWDKINHAYSYGKGKLTRRTVERLLGVKIDYLVEVDKQGAEKLIDAIGGVTIDVEKKMYYEDPWDDNGGLVIDLEPGVQTLDGSEAMQYIRYRDAEGDIGRAKRQQKFLEAAMDSVASPLTLVRTPRIIYACASSIETDMSSFEMLKLLPTVALASCNGMEKIFADGKPAYIGGVSYWALDAQKLRTKMAKVAGVRPSKALLKEAAQMEEAVRAEQLAEQERKEAELKEQEEKDLLEQETEETSDEQAVNKEAPKTVKKEAVKADAKEVKKAVKKDVKKVTKKEAAKSDKKQAKKNDKKNTRTNSR